MTSGIATIVEQLAGASRIPRSAKPRTNKPAPKPPAREVKPRPDALDKLAAALSDRYESVRVIAGRAGVSYHTALHLLPQLMRLKRAGAREVGWRNGARVVYRRPS